VKKEKHKHLVKKETNQILGEKREKGKHLASLSKRNI
jgi:hypothetical protein